MDRLPQTLAWSSPPPANGLDNFSSEAGNSSHTNDSPSQRTDWQQRLPSSPLGPYGAQGPRPVTPGAFISPRSIKRYPIPSTTADALEARRQAIFSKAVSTHQQRRLQSLNARPSAMPDDGPTLQPGPSIPSRRSNYKQPPSSTMRSPGGLGNRMRDDYDLSASLYRQRFRERCQAAMARERGRSKALARARGRDFDAEADAAGDEDDDRILKSDDLLSSDMEEDAGGWQEDDEELIRHVMLAEYRRLLANQEHSGQRELGWLDADEVAWLEEEVRRDEELRQACIDDGGEEPPSDMIDEEASLYEQYRNASLQEEQGGVYESCEFMEDDDDALYADPALLNLERTSNTLNSGTQMDTF